MIKNKIMKPYTIYLVLSALLFVACEKEKNTNTPQLPWRFTLTDSVTNKTYRFDAQTYGYGNVHNPDYPYFDSKGSSDSITRYDVSANAIAILTKTASVNIVIGISSFIDTVKSRKLAKGNTLSVKQNTLKEIFIPGNIFPLGGSLKQPPGFTCYYDSENGNRYSINALNIFAGDVVKINSSEIWDDGSGIAKIKVSLEYNCHVQGFTGTGTWLPEIKKISGTMQTFFTVQ
jgi:hypothetical protein